MDNTLTTSEEGIIQEALKQFDALDIQPGADSLSVSQKLGVLQRLVTAVKEDDEYRQILLTASFDSKHEAQMAADAIEERKRYGVSIRPILDRIIAQCSVKGARVNLITDASSRFTLNTNTGKKLPNWKRQQDNKGLT